MAPDSAYSARLDSYGSRKRDRGRRERIADLRLHATDDVERGVCAVGYSMDATRTRFSNSSSASEGAVLAMKS